MTERRQHATLLFFVIRAFEHSSLIRHSGFAIEGFEKVPWVSRPWLFSSTKTKGQTPVIQVFQRSPSGFFDRVNMNILITLAADVLKTVLPMLFTFLWNQAHEPTTVENAKVDDARRDRLLAAVRLRRSQSGDNPNHPARQLAETVNAYVYIETTDGKRVKSANRTPLYEGEWVLTDPSGQ